MLGTAWHLVSGAVGPSSESWLSSNNLNATFGRHSYHGHDLKPISLEHLANGTFTVQRESLDWLPEGELESGDHSVASCYIGQLNDSGSLW